MVKISILQKLAVFGLLVFISVAVIYVKITPETPSISESPTYIPTYIPNPSSIESIFSRDHTWVATLSAQRIRTVMATGDVIPARSVNFQVDKYKDYNWPYQYTAGVLKKADITLINLETPLVRNCPPVNEGMIFCGDENNIAGLISSGIDVVSIANNHAGNYGIEAVKSTIRLLQDNGILVTGFNGPIYKEIKGLNIAFLGYNDIGYQEDGISWANEEKIRLDIQEAKIRADIAVVEFHWGSEYTSQPTDRQKFLAHLAIDAGADLIIGNHPHWIQPVEFYQGKFIAYAHGNFVFDQEWSLKTKQGVVGIYTFYDRQLIDVEFLPVFIKNYGQPYFLEGKEKQDILKDLYQQSLILAVNDK